MSTTYISSADPALLALDPVARIKALVASKAPVVIQRVTGTSTGVIAGLRISYAALGQPYEFDDADGNLLADPAPGPTETNIVQGPIAGPELTAFLANPAAADEVSVAITAFTPTNVTVAPGTTLQGGVLRDGAGNVIPPATVSPITITAAAPHALESAPVNSKVVVAGQRAAVLATPAGVTPLPAGDPAHLLPQTTTIQKLENGFKGVYKGIEGKVEVIGQDVHKIIEELLNKIHAL